MKIDKLYTLSQFIDLYRGEWNYGTPYIYLYNDFLKQPLTKEMFVNEVKVKLASENTDEYIKQWQEAEKKVIFNNLIKEEASGYDAFYIGKLKIGHFWKDGSNFVLFKTLSRLAEVTNGKLKLKNVEL